MSLKFIETSRAARSKNGAFEKHVLKTLGKSLPEHHVALGYFCVTDSETQKALSYSTPNGYLKALQPISANSEATAQDPQEVSAFIDLEAYTDLLSKWLRMNFEELTVSQKALKSGQLDFIFDIKNAAKLQKAYAGRIHSLSDLKAALELVNKTS